MCGFCAPPKFAILASARYEGDAGLECVLAKVLYDAAGATVIVFERYLHSCAQSAAMQK